MDWLDDKSNLSHTDARNSLLRGPYVGYKSRQLHTHLKVRLSEREQTAFQQAAELAGLTLSAWVRMALRERIPEAFSGTVRAPFAGKGIAP